MALSRIDVIGFSVLLLPLLAPDQSQFDGTWKLKMNSAKIPKTTNVFLLQNGMYEWNGWVRIKADGTDQNVTGFPEYDTMSITVIDDYNVEVKTKRDGKVVRTEEDSISANGDTLNVSFTLSYGTGQGSGHYTCKRVAKGPAGANLLSGSWRVEEVDASPDLRASGRLWIKPSNFWFAPKTAKAFCPTTEVGSGREIKKPPGGTAPDFGRQVGLDQLLQLISD